MAAADSASTASSTAQSTPRWTRVVLVLLGVPNVLTGAWAVVAPLNWYKNFPGWMPRLISAFPPYNEHLATDAGTGLLVTGLLVLAAALWPRRDVVLTASGGFATLSVIHAAYHLLNPAPHHALTGAEAAVNNVTLVAAAVASTAVFLTTLRRAP